MMTMWQLWKAHLVECAICTSGQRCETGSMILGPNKASDAPWLRKHADTHAQPVPTGSGLSVTDAVVEDLTFRREQGTKKYGTELLTDNGRDALVDAYQEALDLVVYLKQTLMERDLQRAS